MARGGARRVPAAALAALLLLPACAARPQAREPVELTVLVYNIHAGKDAAGERNLDRVASLVESTGADVALLQEVDRGTERSGGEDQAATLEALTGDTAVFGRTLDYQGGEYGIAVLSGFPVGDRGVVPLAVQPPQQRAGGSYEPRGMLVVTVATPAGMLRVVNTHLDASRSDHYRIQEVEQLVALADSLRGAGGPVVLGGDLNAEPDSDVIALLRAAGWQDAWDACGAGDGLTFPASAPVKRIDYLFISAGLECVHAEVIATVASDHRPLLVHLRAAPDLPTRW